MLKNRFQIWIGFKRCGTGFRSALTIGFTQTFRVGFNLLQTVFDTNTFRAARLDGSPIRLLGGPVRAGPWGRMANITNNNKHQRQPQQPNQQQQQNPSNIENHKNRAYPGAPARSSERGQGCACFDCYLFPLIELTLLLPFLGVLQTGK